MSIFNVGIVQPMITEDLNANLVNAARLVKQAASEGADIAVLPEMFCCPCGARYFKKYKEPRGGHIWTSLSDMARSNGICLVGGSMPESEDGKIYNTSYIFDADGNEIGRHRKMHMFDIDIEGKIRFRESDTITHGDDVTVVDTAFGRIGVEICFDIRFPELARLMALKGAQIVFVPAVFNLTTGPLHWELFMRSRAVDNQLYMVGCAPARNTGNRYVEYSHSIAADPWGNVITDLGEEEKVSVIAIDTDVIDDVRSQLPLLSARRTDIY